MGSFIGIVQFSDSASLRLGLTLDSQRQELVVTVASVGPEELPVTRDALSLEVKTLAERMTEASPC